MFEKTKEKFQRRYVGALIELEKRKARKAERDKKKMMSLKAGTIGYGLAMKQKPWEVYHSVIEKRRYEREQKRKDEEEH